MIIEVKPAGKPQATGRWHYNAPNNIRAGNEVELPNPSGGGSWVGEVTSVGNAAQVRLMASHYAGPIKAIIGKHVPLHVELTARNKRELLEKIRDLVEDMEDER